MTFRFTQWLRGKRRRQGAVRLSRPALEVLEDRVLPSGSPLTAGAVTPPHPVEGKAVSRGTVFHFTDSIRTAKAGDFTATVRPGDGSVLTSSANPQSVQVLANVRGGFDVVFSNYTFADELKNAVFAVQVQDQAGNQTSASAAFSVADAPLSLTLATLHLAQGPNNNVTVATFTDADPHPDISTFSAVIRWGDGAVSTATAAAGTIVRNANGSFGILGSHA